jgi:hypothetical protein
MKTIFFEYVTLKEFHEKYIKSKNKTCLIFNQVEKEFTE